MRTVESEEPVMRVVESYWRQRIEPEWRALEGQEVAEEGEVGKSAVSEPKRGESAGWRTRVHSPVLMSQIRMVRSREPVMALVSSN